MLIHFPCLFKPFWLDSEASGGGYRRRRAQRHPTAGGVQVAMFPRRAQVQVRARGGLENALAGICFRPITTYLYLYIYTII